MTAKTAAVLLGIVMLAGVARAGAPAKGAPSNGKATFLKSCASCHGKDGKGNPGMAKAFKGKAGALDLLDAETRGKTDEELKRLTAEGAGKMPSFKGKLSAESISQTIEYLRSLGPKAK